MEETSFDSPDSGRKLMISMVPVRGPDVICLKAEFLSGWQLQERQIL